MNLARRAMLMTVMTMVLLPQGAGAVPVSESGPSEHLRFDSTTDAELARHPTQLGQYYALGGHVEVIRTSDWTAYRTTLLMTFRNETKEIGNESIRREEMNSDRSIDVSYQFAAGFPGTWSTLAPGQPLSDLSYNESRLGQYEYLLRVMLMNGSEGAWSPIPESAIHALFRVNVSAPIEHEREDSPMGGALPLVISVLAGLVTLRRRARSTFET